jgi:hypothetical protein
MALGVLPAFGLGFGPAWGWAVRKLEERASRDTSWGYRDGR